MNAGIRDTTPAGPGIWPPRTVSLAITDNTGASWAATGLMVRYPHRGRAARRAGWALALLLVAGLMFVAPLFVGWTVAIVHGWWPTIPRMPYGVGLRLAAVTTLAIVVRTVVTEVIGFLVAPQASAPSRLTRGTAHWERTTP